MSKNRKIALIAGGGTGGHLFPALSIGKELQKNKIDVQYIGSKYGIEKQIFENSNLNYHLLNITGIKRDFSFKSLYLNFLFPFRFVLSYLKSLFIINSIKPSIIIGTGGYASGLPLIAGIHLNIPTVIQDQNSVPGLITRTLHNKTTRIYLAYKVAKEKLESLKNKPSLNADHSADTESPKSENVEVTSTEIPAPKPTTSKSSVTEDQVIHVASRPTPVMQRPNHLPEQSKEMVPPVANNAKIVRKEPGSRFMTASERRRELNKLAREMELLFVDKLNM